MRDKFKVETFYTISNRDWNEIVRRQYDVSNYDFWDDNEAERDGSRSYTFTTKKGYLSKYDLEELEKFKIGQAMFMTDIILTDLCNQDLIDEGQYIIDEVGC